MPSWLPWQQRRCNDGPPRKVRLQTNTTRLMRKRKEWRRRALGAALSLTTWPAGKPGREEIERETIKCLGKVSEWFREHHAKLVISAIQRRAIHQYRLQFNKQPETQP